MPSILSFGKGLTLTELNIQTSSNSTIENKHVLLKLRSRQEMVKISDQSARSVQSDLHLYQCDGLSSSKTLIMSTRTVPNIFLFYGKDAQFAFRTIVSMRENDVFLFIQRRHFRT